MEPWGPQVHLGSGEVEWKPQFCENYSQLCAWTSLEGSRGGRLLTPQGGGIVGDFFSFLYCWYNAIWAINKNWEEKNSCSVN